MTITRVQEVGTANNGGTSLSVTLAAATAGNFLAAHVVVGSTASNGTCTTPSGYTLAVGPVTTESGAVSDCNEYLFFKIAAGGETSFTATDTVSSGITIQAWEFSSSTGWPASPLDVTATSPNQAATLNPVTGTTATTAQAEELWLAGMTTHFATGEVYSSPLNGFTLETTQTAGASSFFAPTSAALYKIVSATGTASTGATVGTSKPFAGFVATFKNNPAGGGGSLIANAVLSEPAAQVVTSGNAQQANAVLSSPAAVVVASGQIMQSNAAMTVVARVVAGASPLIANSALVSPSAQVVAPATQQSNAALVQLAAQLVARGDALVANAILAGTGSSSGGGGSSTGASLHGVTVVRPSGEVGLSVVRTAENGLTSVRGYLQGASVVRPSESAVSDTVRASLVGSTVIRGG